MTIDQQYMGLRDKYLAKFGTFTLQDQDVPMALGTMILFMVYCLDHGKPFEDLTDQEYLEALRG